MALYMKAAEILEKAERKQGALKTLVYDSKFANIKQLFALVCETQKFSSILVEIIETTKLLKQTKLRLPLAKVLVYDLLMGQGLKCGGSWKAMMMKHRSRLQAVLARMKVKQKVSNNEDLLPAKRPASSRGPAAQICACEHPEDHRGGCRGLPEEGWLCLPGTSLQVGGSNPEGEILCEGHAPARAAGLLS
ncbi:putative 28S rRNA (cytosine-C(5))-methyltransferase [Larimichthys crocea]|uniref:Uncharacterized protein n=1 Tax=Larimichthys crocea TaxID=215358 RepID=A0ACD3RAG0_LARCR|nr:putative 28S rRNA (cytosine-C(5))-methyltransferase [Larimichthys crocea]